jgi:hypothetical protein
MIPVGVGATVMVLNIFVFVALFIFFTRMEMRHTRFKEEINRPDRIKALGREIERLLETD